MTQNIQKGQELPGQEWVLRYLKDHMWSSNSPLGITVINPQAFINSTTVGKEQLEASVDWEAKLGSVSQGLSTFSQIQDQPQKWRAVARAQVSFYNSVKCKVGLPPKALSTKRDVIYQKE